ncbi:MAG: PilZ domain-containing protein [Desulfofustis sp.]
MRSESIYRGLSSGPSKIFVSEDGLAAITCPNCGITKQVSVADYCGNKNVIKVRCRCSKIFTTKLEFRQYHRKSTELPGTYNIITDRGGGRAIIKDLSKNGIGFMVSGINHVRVGHKILIDFSLDDHKQTPLSKTAVVRSVQKNRIGCEFNKDQAFEKDLGFYLRS